MSHRTQIWELLSRR